MEEAVKMARLDSDQHVIREFRAYKGDPLRRTTIEFEVIFEDNDVVWLPYSSDLFTTQQYESFCDSHRQLKLLLFSSEKALRMIHAKQTQKITEVQPGDIVYVNIRWYSEDWFQQLDLPDMFVIQYVVAFKFIDWSNNAHTKIHGVCDVFDEDWPKIHGYDIYAWMSQKDFEAPMCLVDTEFCRQYPQCLKHKQDALVPVDDPVDLGNVDIPLSRRPRGRPKKQHNFASQMEGERVENE
jgi:hypothetical protein